MKFKELDYIFSGTYCKKQKKTYLCNAFKKAG